MAGTWGKNRLASGFTKPSKPREQEAWQPPSPKDFPQTEPVAVDSPDSVIEISEDEEDVANSEGGIVLNFEHEKNGFDVVSLSDGEDSGEVHSDDSMQYSPRMNPQQSDFNTNSVAQLDDGVAFTIDPTPKGLFKKLADLTPQQRESQLRYAFYHLDRDQIDLSRPVICLQCFEEGHLDADCPQQTLFPVFKNQLDRATKLWLSCCVCASKTHLVGDCPQSDRTNTARWSLADLDPNNIINLSLEKGTQRLEKEVESRGLRPNGLSIKGRANRHTAGAQPNPGVASSDDEPFLHSKRPRNDATMSRRYDRADLPPDSPNRGRSGWYATDSFGRKRSPSPISRPAIDDRRSRSPRGDSWRSNAHGGADTWRRSQQASAPRGNRYQSSRRAPSPSRRSTQNAPLPAKPTSALPNSRISIDLPTRKGSNTWKSDNSSSINPTPSNTRATHQRTKPQTKRGGRRKGNKT